jgi:UDP-N-acetylglucosamine--N-acetylmuramyl-(pentapeptide) pyrophosphoryl-undecaprenol N-acetylglucosamine transferase
MKRLLPEQVPLIGGAGDLTQTRGQPIFAVITGGGTAGHVLPALAIAEELQARGHPANSLHFVGAQRGIETRLLPETPYPHTFLDVVGVQRRRLRGNLAFIPKLARAVRAARRLLRELRPRVVVSVGGYASLPAVLAARRLRIPVVVVSFDRLPGRASALAARFASASAVAFEGSALRRATVTGAPVRMAIRDVDRATGRDAARAALGLPADRFVLAVTGGSQGSGALNDAIVAYAKRHGQDRGLAIHHVAGERFAEALASEAAAPSGAIHQIVGYERRMDLVYTATDLLVGRGGASTVAEVAATGTPSILVPWPGAAEDHQADNVGWLADQGGAVHLPEAELANLDRHIDALRSNTELLSELSANARAAGERHRGGLLGALVESVALPGPQEAGQ